MSAIGTGSSAVSRSTAGRRVAALSRWGAEVVSRRPNGTLSWLTGSPVERLTVLRRVSDRRMAA